MTETEWHSATSVNDLDLWETTKNQNRKWRLFAAACCDRAVKSLNDPRLGPILLALDQYVDWEISWEELKRIRKILPLIRKEIGLEWVGKNERLHFTASALDDATAKAPQLALNSVYAVQFAFASMGRGRKDETRRMQSYRAAEERVQLQLARDIFGNPFRTIVLDSRWHTSTAVGLARTMYDARDFGAMPILADALQDAGCEDESVLTHCRDAKQVHVRGCWVVDRVLGKS